MQIVQQEIHKKTLLAESKNQFMQALQLEISSKVKILRAKNLIIQCAQYFLLFQPRYVQILDAYETNM